MNIGRNDPCHCGSGKKYKKCCLAKDEEAKRAQEEEARRARPVASPPPAAGPTLPLPSPPRDPWMEAWEERWEEFEAADYEGQIALFTRTLEEQELMDGEMAFEMLSHLYDEMVKHDERDRFDALVASLRERLPEVYAQESSYFLLDLSINALVAGRDEEVAALARELAEKAGKEIDLFNNLVDGLAYHGRLSVLVEMMRLAWPKVQRSRDIISWGVGEFAERASDFEIFDYVEHHPAPKAHDPSLLERLKPYVETDSEQFAPFLAHLTGQAKRQWALSDFTFTASRGRSRRGRDEAEQTASGAADGAQNLYFLSAEFLGYLRREEGVPYTKGELARKHLQQFILQRQAGDLEERESLLESALRSGRGRPKPKPKPFHPEHVLCPDRDHLDRYLAGLLDFVNPQRYDVAATFELVPAWLRFLESRRLIDAAQRLKTLRELSGLDTELLEIMKQFSADPSLQQAVQRWREEAERAS